MINSHFWLYQHRELVDRFLHSIRQIEVWDKEAFWELFGQNPAEAQNLIQKSHFTETQKVNELISFIVESPQVTCGIFADQRMGKDATVCQIFTEANNYLISRGRKPPRIVTLNNIKIPPFVDPKDRYFSFRRIPIGTKEQEVWIYCSEIETVLPARDFSNPESQLFSQLEGTMAQNHQKLFGCVKLASKVDLNFIRGMNVKILKFISPEKLLIKGVERTNILTDLAKIFIPGDRTDFSAALLVFNNNILVVHFPLPYWWSDEYSEQFSQVQESDLDDFILVCSENGMKPFSISTAIAQKFRVQISENSIKSKLELT